jgi:hypothetical protein
VDQLLAQLPRLGESEGVENEALAVTGAGGAELDLA